MTSCLLLLVGASVKPNYPYPNSIPTGDLSRTNWLPLFEPSVAVAMAMAMAVARRPLSRSQTTMMRNILKMGKTSEWLGDADDGGREATMDR